jgi:polyphosphate glucokinase
MVNTNGANRGKNRSTRKAASDAAAPPRSVLVVDVGGSNVKLLVNGETEPRKIPSGREMTALQMVESVKEATQDWKYDAISLGYPGLVGSTGPVSEPGNLGPGWVGFDFAAAFEKPIRVINDAALQALGSYEGGRMLFLGLGTGLGSALICQSALIPLELGSLPHPAGETYGGVLGRRGLKRVGKKRWRKFVIGAVESFLAAFQVDYIVLGGGNSKLLRVVPTIARIAHNQTAFRGGFRLWHSDEIQTLSRNGEPEQSKQVELSGWRML